ncbi:hypothetical protein ACE1ET_09540 [Saccharicrinis sp. FJH62]|uniref:hypothetical protein n=1 Tax=Saccharicrinis sp. FJH62 TaxID=3344657 RepID=UPI0035D42925
MKKHIMIITVALFTLSCSSNEQKSKTNTQEQIKKYQEDSKQNRESISDSDAISLKWKLKPDETIGYKTAMEQVESSDLEIDFGDDKNMPKEEFKKIFDGLKKEFEKTSFITTMQWNDRGNIETKMFTEDFNDKDNKPIDPKNFNPASMMKGIVLRGEINESGKIESFYLKGAQKNLIAMYFELPDRPVKIGDTWSLNVSYLQFDQSFACRSADRTNNVELIDILKDKNDTIAVIKYDISESASGYMKNPMTNGKIETSLSMSFTGIAEFSINKGRWLKYNGILETTQKGMMSGSSKQKLALIPFDDLTKEMINIE